MLSNTVLRWSGIDESESLGGKIVAMMKHGEQPGANNAPGGPLKGILYAHIFFGDTEVMASDVAPERFQPMRSAYLSLSVDSSQEAERVHALLTEGGEVFMPMEETFFAFRFSMLRDRFGTSWMTIHQKPMS
jgi:PhnB protein